MLLEAHIFPPKWFYLYIFLSLVVEKKKKKLKLFQVHEKRGLASSLTIFCCILGRGISLSFSNQRDKNLLKLTKLAVNNRFDGRTPESPAPLANQVSVFLLSNFPVLLFCLFLNHFVGTPHSVWLWNLVILLFG